MRKLLVLLFAISSFVPVFAWECLGYEKELEGYFFQYKSGEMVDIPLVDRLNNRCNSPSAKFNMLYYYFLAVDAYHSNDLTDEESFEKASDYYETCASYFSEFDWNRQDRFLESFYTRAEGLEVVLADLAFDLGYKSRIRYVQKSRGGSGSPWKKSNIARFVDSRDQGRGQDYRGENPDSKVRFSKKYPVFQPNPQYDKQGEPYGYVGNISSINPIDYLKYLGSNSQRAEDYLYTYSEESDALIAANARLRQARGNYSQSRGEEELSVDGDLIGIYDRTYLLERPGGRNNSSNDYLGFGEYAYRVQSESPVVNGGKTYVKVEVPGGKTGWIPINSTVEQGEIAVLIENTRGIPRMDMRNSERNAVLFKTGELIILEDFRNGMVKAVSRNGDKAAWIQDIGNISIEEADIQIAMLLHHAINNYSSRDLRSQLEAIKYFPGYAESPLARLIEDTIRVYEGN